MKVTKQPLLQNDQEVEKEKSEYQEVETELKEEEDLIAEIGKVVVEIEAILVRKIVDDLEVENAREV